MYRGWFFPSLYRRSLPSCPAGRRQDGGKKPASVWVVLCALILASDPAQADDPSPAPHISDWLAEKEGVLQVGGDGVARLIFRPEHRSVPDLVPRLAAHGLEKLAAQPIPPWVDLPPVKPGAPPTRAPSRLMLLGREAATVRRAHEILERLDVPRRSAFVSILATEVRKYSLRESGGSLLYDKGVGPNPSNTLFRSYVTSFEPDAYLRSSLSGMMPFEGTTLTFGDMPAGGGTLRYALRALLKTGCAEYLAWPNLVVTEDAPPATMESLRVLPQTILASGQPDPLVTSVIIQPAEVGLKLRLTAVRIGHDSAVLDLDVWLTIPESVEDGSGIVGTVRLKTRQVRTRLTLRDREPLMLGGLTIRRCLRSRRGIPRPSQLAVLDPLHSALSRDGRDTELVFLIRMRSATPGNMPAEMRPSVYRGWSQGKTKTDPFGRKR